MNETFRNEDSTFFQIGRHYQPKDQLFQLYWKSYFDQFLLSSAQTKCSFVGRSEANSGQVQAIEKKFSS
jgi:hypothetical protein